MPFSKYPGAGTTATAATGVSYLSSFPAESFPGELMIVRALPRGRPPVPPPEETPQAAGTA